MRGGNLYNTQWVDTNEIKPEELEKFVCIGISKIMGDYSIH